MQWEEATQVSKFHSSLSHTNYRVSRDFGLTCEAHVKDSNTPVPELFIISMPGDSASLLIWYQQPWPESGYQHGD